MTNAGLGSHIHSLSSAWSTESRGPRLHPSDFETRTQIRAGHNPVEAILVLPVAAQAGSAGGKTIAEYPLYAAVAVDSETLLALKKIGLAEDRHATITEAAAQARALNAQSENDYLNDYQSGRLTSVQGWEKTEAATAAPIILRPAANQSLSI